MNYVINQSAMLNALRAGASAEEIAHDFNEALKDVQKQFAPDRILIEPSGVGKLSDVIVAVEETAAETDDMVLNSFVTVADASKVKVYMKNFGEFYNNQIESAGTIILSRTQKLSQEKLILSAIEKVSLADELLEKMRAEHEEHEHHHHDHECDDPHCSCHHDHDHEHHHEHDHHEHEHEHEHHDHNCECGCHDHHHDHDHEHHHHDHDHDHDHDHHHEHEHGADCTCGCHDHHHHHAEDVFTSWGKETPKAFTQNIIHNILEELDSGEYGQILRAKGIVNGEGGVWIEFDYVPEEHEIRAGHADYTGRLCVIGANLNETKLAELFGL